MKRMWNSFKIAFSMYSRLPMPESEWSRENLSYALIYFPWIGGLIGLITYGIFRLKEWCAVQGTGISDLTFLVFMVLVPVLITGGIHMDGFMDTQDALSSYQPKERRLEILKDSHAGAFAILSCTVYFLCCTAIYASLTERSVKVTALGFLLSRTLSGLSVVTFPQAKKDGLADGKKCTGLLSRNSVRSIDRCRKGSRDCGGCSGRRGVFLLLQDVA